MKETIDVWETSGDADLTTISDVQEIDDNPTSVAVCQTTFWGRWVYPMKFVDGPGPGRNGPGRNGPEMNFDLFDSHC